MTKIEYLEYIKNWENSVTKRQATQLKNGQKSCLDISPKKIYKWLIGT
jgi:hypothetical protein